jgi:hypothetical protein
MRYRTVMMSAITHLFCFCERKIHNTNNRKQKASAVWKCFHCSITIILLPSHLRFRVEGLGWQKFTVEIKNNAFQNDTLNTIEARSESEAAI